MQVRVFKSTGVFKQYNPLGTSVKIILFCNFFANGLKCTFYSKIIKRYFGHSLTHRYPIDIISIIDGTLNESHLSSLWDLVNITSSHHPKVTDLPQAKLGMHFNCISFEVFTVMPYIN